jgi:hypothetical protein
MESALTFLAYAAGAYLMIPVAIIGLIFLVALIFGIYSFVTGR